MGRRGLGSGQLAGCAVYFGLHQRALTRSSVRMPDKSLRPEREVALKAQSSHLPSHRSIVVTARLADDPGAG
jgi:hypothetical protein